jgi:hypothetical protein
MVGRARGLRPDQWPERDPGRCYLRAGFRQIGVTKAGLIALGLTPEDMPDAAAPLGAQFELELLRAGGRRSAEVSG